MTAWGLIVVSVCLAGILVAGMARSDDSRTGHPRVVDGDTLAFGSERVHLGGIDAPEALQTCRHGWVSRWPCGLGSTDALRAIIGVSTVTCRTNERNFSGRLITVCYVGDTDLNRAMVRRGHAVPIHRHDRRYKSYENAARRERIGMWQGQFVHPRQWRKGERLPSGDSVTGQARVIDGDTLVIGNERVRFIGMDAPETRQVCEHADGGRWPCGQAAKKALQALIGDEPVTCRGDKLSRYGRRLAVCRVGGMDVGRLMVRQGNAVLFKPYGLYATDEATARRARTGIWQGRFIQPRRWRRGDRLP